MIIVIGSLIDMDASCYVMLVHVSANDSFSEGICLAWVELIKNDRKFPFEKLLPSTSGKEKGKAKKSKSETFTINQLCTFM
jgi:hypothetical protein